jgi:diacylglycerol kinase (ATP)
VMVSRATTSGSVLRYLAELLRGRVHSDPAVQYLRGTRIQVSARGSTTFWCSADGELSGPMPGRSWQLLPGALSMVLPDRSG